MDVRWVGLTRNGLRKNNLAMMTKVLLTVARWAISAAILVAWIVGSKADELQLLWQVSPGERGYVTTGNTERGVALNPVNTNVLFISRAGGPQVYVLSPKDGSDADEAGSPRMLNQIGDDGVAVVSGGTFVMNLVGVAEDGAVYVCNLVTSSASSPFKIYRWANDTVGTTPTVAYEGNPADGSDGAGNDLRYGDAFAVRGKGASTQLLVSSRSGRFLVLFTTTDGLTFTANRLTTDANGQIGLGVAFGPGNTVWGKVGAAPLRHLGLDLAAKTATTLRTFDPQIASTGPIGGNVAGHRLAMIDYGAHKVHLYDVTDPGNPIKQGEQTFATANANANGTGATDMVGETLVALDSNNGLMAIRVIKPVLPDPPTINTPPSNASVYAGAPVSLAVVAGGTPPLSYAWQLNGVALPGATNAQLKISAAKETDAGDYVVVVSNAAASVPSAVAKLTVLIPRNTSVLTPLWSLRPGDGRSYITTDNTQRGLAYNPATGNVILVSRAGGNKIVVLDGTTGAEKHLLRTTDSADVSVITGGTLALDMVGVSEDGVIYVGNLVTDGAASPFKLYRWANDGADTVPEVVSISGLEVAQRWGDTMDIRGRGNETQVLLGSRNGKAFAVLTTSDGGLSFAGTVFEVLDAANGNFGLGIAFGSGNTIWGTANGASLRHASFDLTAGTAATIADFPGAVFPASVTAVAFDPVENLLAAIALENPDNTQLYRWTAAGGTLELIDQELILPENANANGTGAADFGGGRLYVLDTNNGIQAFAVNPSAGGSPAGLHDPAMRNGVFSFQLTGSAGASYKVQYSSDLKQWTELGAYAAPQRVEHAAESAALMRFYRAVGN